MCCINRFALSRSEPICRQRLRENQSLGATRLNSDRYGKGVEDIAWLDRRYLVLTRWQVANSEVTSYIGPASPGMPLPIGGSSRNAMKIFPGVDGLTTPDIENRRLESQSWSRSPSSLSHPRSSVACWSPLKTADPASAGPARIGTHRIAAKIPAIVETKPLGPMPRMHAFITRCSLPYFRCYRILRLVPYHWGLARLCFHRNCREVEHISPARNGARPLRGYHVRGYSYRPLKAAWLTPCSTPVSGMRMSYR